MCISLTEEVIILVHKHWGILHPKSHWGILHILLATVYLRITRPPQYPLQRRPPAMRRTTLQLKMMAADPSWVEELAAHQRLPDAASGGPQTPPQRCRRSGAEKTWATVGQRHRGPHTRAPEVESHRLSAHTHARRQTVPPKVRPSPPHKTMGELVAAQPSSSPRGIPPLASHQRTTTRLARIWGRQMPVQLTRPHYPPWGPRGGQGGPKGDARTSHFQPTDCVEHLSAAGVPSLPYHLTGDDKRWW